MFEKLAIIALALLVLPPQNYSQANKTQKDSRGDQPTHTAPNVSVQQDSGSKLQSEPQEHVQAEVRITSTPDKDIYDKVLVIVAVLGIGVGVCTLLILKRQTSAIEKEIVLTQRPKIIIRTIFFTEPQGTLGAIPNGVVEGSMMTGQFYIVNTGGTKATVKEIFYMFDFRRARFLPARRPWEGRSGKECKIDIISGQSVPHVFGYEPELTQEQIQDIRRGEMFLYLMGWVDYTDAIGTRRTTRFCRLYDPGEERFHPVADAEYESAD